VLLKPSFDLFSSQVTAGRYPLEGQILNPEKGNKTYKKFYSTRNENTKERRELNIPYLVLYTR
jgi:hypothetical protein